MLVLGAATAGVACDDGASAEPIDLTGSAGRGAGGPATGGGAGAPAAGSAGAPAAGGAGAPAAGGSGGAAGGPGAGGGEGGAGGGATLAVDLRSPRPGQVVTSRAAWLRGTVGGAALPTTLTYEVNGGGETVVPLDPSGGGAFGFAVPLRPGANEVVVRAAGAEVRRSFSFGSRTTAGGLHTGALRSGGAYAWGRNNRGQLGLGPAATDDGHVPAPLPDSGDVGWLWFGQNSSLAVRRDGTLWAWGENDDGQLGLGSAAAPDVEPRNAPTRVAGVAGVVAAALGFGHGLALLADGTLVAFGADNRGQLGDGEAGADRSAPGPVVDLTDVVKVVGGAQHSVALRADGTVWAWGRNGFGALGLGAIDDEPHPRPAPVPGLAGVVDVATGRDHVLALRADGTVWAWGLNENGQVGDGTSGGPDRASPAAVAGLADAVAVYANGSTSFALKADGTLWGWGQNFNGQLGIGEDKNDKPAPSAPVVGLADVVGVGPGPTHVVAERGDGSLFVWGWSARGSLGGADLLENWPYPEPVALPLAP